MIENGASSGEIVAVVPAYNPSGQLVDLVAAVRRQVARVVVVDDGSSTRAAADVFEECVALGARLLQHDANRGIAAALNTGVRASFEGRDDPEAILTLDQDSRVRPGFVDALRAAQTIAESSGIVVGLIAPDRVQGLPPQGRVRRSDGIVLGRDPIQSGVLLPVRTWQTVGPFDESLFVDGVDTDYALRCLDAGLAVVVAPGLELRHRLGGSHDISVGRRTLSLTASAPFRYYYLTRNRVRLVRRHALRHPAWAAGLVAGTVRHLGIVLTVVPDRRTRAREAWRGIRDGLRGTTGRRPAGARKLD
jgi:rhamnosyltransferase